MTDKDFLKMAIDKGNEVDAPYNFGAIVVKNRVVLGSDHAHVTDLHDPSAHSEVCAMRLAGQKVQNWRLEGCTLYASHEPCTMCLSCAAWAGIERIVFVTPASAQNDVMYEFKEPDIFGLATMLTNPIKIEQCDLS